MPSITPRPDISELHGSRTLITSAQKSRICLEVMADGRFNVLEAAVAARVKRVVAALPSQMSLRWESSSFR
jgi:hypothetical protein